MSRTERDRPTAYLICGKVGSGKTTYATSLATEVQAAVYSIDVWMATLYGADTPKTGKGGPIDFAWYAERVDRCEAMIWELCKQQIAQHRNVVLDLGFLRVARRQKFVEWAAAAGAGVQVHLLEVDITTRRERVAARNRLRAGTYSFAVTDEMFDFAEAMFEPLDAAEMHQVIAVDREATLT